MLLGEQEGYRKFPRFLCQCDSRTEKSIGQLHVGQIEEGIQWVFPLSFDLLLAFGWGPIMKAFFASHFLTTTELLTEETGKTVIHVPTKFESFILPKDWRTTDLGYCEKFQRASEHKYFVENSAKAHAVIRCGCEG
jgi:hypothetical protein